ncbi:TRAP transporter small permease [Marispirochaeta sp.]|uniref:TRAP transporter small permease n=1 Tax=Marispirochaeta sp. TaxID=2038653 RepID=UPI0029C689BA|nr:TRAP transporter small permease [Marispirochaeta sp.]
MLKTKKRDCIFRNLEEIIAGAALTITILSIVFNVIVRYFFNWSFNWAEEIAPIGFSWVVFVGAAACYKRNMHIGVDVFVSIIPEKSRRILEVLMAFALPVLFGYLTYLSLIFSFSAWNKPTAVLLIPYTWVDIPAAIGFGLMFIYSLMDLKKLIRKRIREAEEQ